MLLSKLKFNLTVLLLTSINYFVAYLLSSREVVMDYKNLALIFLFTTIWVWLSQKFTCKKTFVSLYISSCILGFIVPYLSYSSEAIFLQRLMKDFLFWYSLPLALIAPITWSNSSKRTNLSLLIISVLISTVALIPLGGILFYYLIFDTQISADSMLAILQTNKQEALEFLKTYISIKTITISMLVLSCLLFTISTIYNRIFSMQRSAPPITQTWYFYSLKRSFVDILHYVCRKKLFC